LNGLHWYGFSHVAQSESVIQLLLASFEHLLLLHWAQSEAVVQVFVKSFEHRLPQSLSLVQL